MNIPIKKCLTFLATHLRKIEFNSSFPINTPYQHLQTHNKHNLFKFNNKFYKQKSGLHMGNPLSRVLACLFLEI